MAGGGDEYVECPEYVDLTVAHRVGHRPGHTGLRGEVEHQGGSRDLERLIQHLAVAHVHPFERRRLGDVVGCAR